MIYESNPQPGRSIRMLYAILMLALAPYAFATPKFPTTNSFIEQGNDANKHATTFTLKGKVLPNMNVDKYLVYIWPYEAEEFPQPMDSVEVKNGQFQFSCHLDQPYSGMLQAVKKDGSIGKFFLEFFFVPGEECKIEIYGEELNDFHLSGSKFYRDWEAFGQFYKKEQKKAIELAGSGDEEFFAALADYNRRHKDEEGCILYQYMWLYAGMDFTIADGIQQGRFKQYIQHRKSEFNKD